MKEYYKRRSFVGQNELKKDIKSGKIQKPNTNNPEEQCDDKYFLGWAKYIFGMYLWDSTAIGYGGYNVPRGRTF